MTAHAKTPASNPSALGAARSALGAFASLMVKTSQAARCGREARRLLDMSDADLASRGLTRDQAVPQAFTRYLAY